ncbi:DUF4287 domain-containing protein [Nocardia puris]|uniref:Uncharacterized protein DUF4287 n=1 Tax=Nocardia puris TaxID=208602 RepID=A0A366DTD7_9NOCA|nr:DUF4287 domain-containing protein [Nocardia puris]MBF6210979.1 DUF4287 domain-containing protein [Nocardia puris]MBF6364575.1 DUF4287 domain-containing protein [Nocardia puris]MBF6459504.1 DUF4287 domain-containing protein [Nocardia puris]RBO92534.1 uncharacterized protein DUF4287 [Nocardia puris]
MSGKPSGPASYFPSIEAKYGKPVTEWFELLAKSGVAGHKGLVEWLKAEHGVGHGHANALVQVHLNPEKWGYSA